MKLIWLDLETTGLVPADCDILEIAVAIADFDDPFNYKHVYHEVLGYHADSAKWLPDFIRSMHTRNGLLEECARSTITIDQVQQALFDVIPHESNKEEKPIIAGSSIHFDHGFIDYHLPAIGERLSYRNYDVSGIKLYAQSLGMPKPPKALAHRAKDDIEESVRHAVQTTEWLRDHFGGR